MKPKRFIQCAVVMLAVAACGNDARAQEQPAQDAPQYGGVPQPQYGGVPQPQYGGVPQPQYGGVPQPQYGGVPQPQYGGVPYGGVPQPQYGGVPAQPTPGTQQVNITPGTQFTAVPQMQNAITGAIQALTRNMESIIKVASMCPNGKIPVAGSITAAEALTATLGTDPCMALSGMGFPVDRQGYELLKTVDFIEKDGPHITMQKKYEEIFPLGIQVEGGIVDDIKIEDNVQFDIIPVSNNMLMLSNVRGIKVEARDSEYMRKHVAKLTDITIGRDAAGQSILNARLTNPEKWFERMVTGHHNKHVGVSIKINVNGQLQFVPVDIPDE